MRRFNSANQGRSESPGTDGRPTRNVQDLQALRSSRRYEYSPKCCTLKDFLALVMGALVVVILWARHGSQTEPEKKSFVFPVYAAAVNLTWRDASFNNPSSTFRGSLRRSLMADKPEASTYISEVRPVVKHIVYRIEVEVKGRVYLMALDTGSWASWLFCNYYPHPQRTLCILGKNVHGPLGMRHHEVQAKDTFYTPAPEDFVSPKKYEQEVAESMGDFSNRYVPFTECGPQLQHMCFELSFHTCSRLAAALVEDGLSISARGSSLNKAAAATLKFGCAFSVSENLVPTIYGLMGLGNMSISIPNQMAKKGLIQHMVGFCFQYGVYQIDHDRLHANLDPVGYFILGQPSDYDKEYQWISMGAKPPENGHDIIYFHSIQMGTYKYNFTKHDMINGATVIDTGSAYMFLIPPLYHRVFEIVSACAKRHGYILDRTYGSHTHFWRSPPLDSYFSIYKHFKEIKMIFYTEEKGKRKEKIKKDKGIEKEEKEDKNKEDKDKESETQKDEEYIFRISPFGYLQVIDILDLPYEKRILHQYIIALAIYIERSIDDEMAVNLIGGIALRGNKLVIDHVKKRIGLRPESKCTI